MHRHDIFKSFAQQKISFPFAAQQMKTELSIGQNEFVNQCDGLKMIIDRYCLNTLPPFLFREASVQEKCSFL